MFHGRPPLALQLSVQAAHVGRRKRELLFLGCAAVIALVMLVASQPGGAAPA